MEKVLPQFDQALALGKHVEDVIFHEFQYAGVPITRTEGQHDFDFYLPNGKSLEWKTDVRSQCTGHGIVERKTLDRKPDYVGVTFTFAKVYPLVLLEAIYAKGKPLKGVGNVGYEARRCARMHLEGVALRDFIVMVKDMLKAA